MYNTPIVMGHEFAGEVTELGKKVSGFNIGDKVMGINLLQEGGYGEIKGIGIFRDGAFADFVAVPKEFMFQAPENIPIVECALIESFAVAARAIKSSNIPENEKIAIIGGGNLGLATLSVLIAEKSPNYCLILEPHEFLRNKALELGASEALPINKVKIRKFLKEHGEPTYIFECAGNEQAVQLAIESVKNRGTIVLEGIQKGKVALPIFLINNRELTLKGSISHDKNDIAQAIELFKQKKVRPSAFISEIVQLKDIQQAFEKYLKPGERNFVKIVVEI